MIGVMVQAHAQWEAKDQSRAVSDLQCLQTLKYGHTICEFLGFPTRAKAV